MTGDLVAIRQQRYAQEKAQGWPEEDARAFLTGARDHWPSMQAALRARAQESGHE